MRIPNIWFTLSVAAAALMFVAGGAGAFIDGVYAKETVSWAAQGAGQDIVSALVAAPLLVISAFAAARGSVRASFIWLGTLAYVAYSYVVYAFFVHFGPWFPVYVAILGLSTWAVAGAALHVSANVWQPPMPSVRRSRAASVFLMVVGAAFALLWLTDIGRALLAGRAPDSVAEAGGAVNPVHVLDLAFAVPATIATAVLLWRRSRAGFVLAVPALVFFALIGLAIVSMMVVMNARGIAAPTAAMAVIGGAVVAAAALAGLLLRRATAHHAHASG